MLIQERIKLIIKANNETPSSFADRIGLKRSNLSHVLSGRNKPSLDFLAKIIEGSPKVNASWLVTGVARVGEIQEDTKSTAENSIDKGKHKKVDRIVLFYSDGSFKEYSNLTND